MFCYHSNHLKLANNACAKKLEASSHFHHRKWLLSVDVCGVDASHGAWWEKVRNLESSLLRNISIYKEILEFGGELCLFVQNHINCRRFESSRAVK